MKGRGILRRLATVVLLVVVMAGIALVQGGSPAAAAPTDAFFSYSGSIPAPGTVLKSRTLPNKFAVRAPNTQLTDLPVTVVQLLYASLDALRRPAVNVVSILYAPTPQSFTRDRVIAYGSYYDSLDPEDSPSRSLASTSAPGYADFYGGESHLLWAMLNGGYNIVVTDVEGQTADLGVGSEYGWHTLFALRAVAKATSVTNIAPTAKIGLMGYSGGGIATAWTGALAHDYAPDVADRLIGVAAGAPMVSPAHTFPYIDGTRAWGLLTPMLVEGYSRATKAYAPRFDLTQYLTANGKKIVADLADDSLKDVLRAGSYRGLKWTDIADPKYPTPESIPAYRELVNILNMGSYAAPSFGTRSGRVPVQLGVGTVSATDNHPNTAGAGDGLMLAGDVRALANKYCSAGSVVRYETYSSNHGDATWTWLVSARAWLIDRFNGVAAPNSCGSIPAGTSLNPI